MSEASEAEIDDRAGKTESSGTCFRKLLESLVDEAQDFTRRKPLEGLLISLIAGMVLSNIIRRGR